MKTFRIISWGGIGDALLTTPSLHALKRQFPRSRVVVYCLYDTHRQVFLNNPHIDTLKRFSVLSNPVYSLLRHMGILEFMTVAYGALFPSKFYSRSAIQIIAEMLGTVNVEDRVEIYLTRREEEAGKNVMSNFTNPIVFQTNAKCSSNKNWSTASWNELILQMPDYTFIQIGSNDEEVIPGAVNMLGRTLRESFSLLKFAKTFIGVDSCFAHASNAFQIPGVVLFGPSTPIIWGHSNNINLHINVPCAPCLDVLYGDPCPYAKPCMDISVRLVKEALISQLFAQGE